MSLQEASLRRRGWFAFVLSFLVIVLGQSALEGFAQAPPPSPPVASPQDAEAPPSPTEVQPPAPVAPAPVLSENPLPLVPGVQPLDNVKLEGLTAALRQEIERSKHQIAALGIEIVDLGSGRGVFNYNPLDTFVTASNTKLITTAAALDALGPDYLFETRVVMRGSLQNGVLAGDLGVIGGGDPNISGRAYEGDSYGVFRTWAHDLVARGVHQIDGDVYLDTGLFESLQIHPDWPRAQLASWYEAPVAALAFNDSCILVRVVPGKRGGQARIETVPPLPLFTIANTATTTRSKHHNYLAVNRAADRLLISGTIWEKASSFDVWIAVPDSVRYFGAALVGALAEEGIVVHGKVHPVDRLPGPVWEHVATYRSDLLDSIRIANKHSQNFYAESLLKLLGARRCGEGSWQQGVRAASDFLATLGIAKGSFTMVDGSGLSRANRFSPHQMATLLRAMYFHRWGAEFVSSLPGSGGADGSLHGRMNGAGYRGNVYAKTGTIDGVSALSGYARSASGHVYAFSILCNRATVWQARQAQDRMVIALIDHG
jgi:D-alanyl-D-alanine carboxypeptidase/D-alanyl-D-alanine-endopeptidase (penicillin-binding protein 4)